MYCTNCGKSLSEKTSFCGNCGTKVEKENNVVEHLSENEKYDLLDGFGDFVSKGLERSKNHKTLSAIAKLLINFPDRYAAKSKTLTFMPKDTRKFIFNKLFKEIMPVQLNPAELPTDENKALIYLDKHAAAIDDLIIDFVISGYNLRLLSTFCNEITDFNQYDGISSPNDLFTENSKPPGMYSDEGMGVPFEVSVIINGSEGLIDTMYKNMAISFPFSKVLSKEQLGVYWTMGWCLARFDLCRRKAKLDESKS